MQNNQNLRLTISWGDFKKCLLLLQAHPEPEFDCLRDIFQEKFLSMQAKELYTQLQFNDLPVETRQSLTDEYFDVKGQIERLRAKKSLKS